MKVPALGLVLLLCAVSASASIDPSSFAALAFHQHPGAQLPLTAELNNASGQEESLQGALGGKPAIVVLEYLHCKNLCSLVLSGAVQAMTSTRLTPGRDVNLVAISIDPRDTARDVAMSEAMYARRFPHPAVAVAGVRFFTGRPDQVHKIAAAIGFPYRYDKLSDQFLHPAGFVVTTADGRISRYMLGLNPNPAELKRAVDEASLEKVEPPAHPLLCLCFGYDPDEGSVAALTWRLVRIVSFGLILACGALIGLLSLRRRSV